MERFKPDKLVYVPLLWRDETAGGARCRGLAEIGEIGKFRKDVIGGGYRRRSILYERVRPGACGTGNVSGHREHLPALFERQTCRDQRPTSVRRLDDEHSTGETGNDAIALRKRPSGRGGIQRVFAYYGAAFLADFVGQMFVDCWIYTR